MSVVAVVGAQWGDEGKGRIVDLLAARAHVVARYQGGSNAGHTVINPMGTFKLHLVPAGIFNPKTVCIIGNGVVLDPVVLNQELANLRTSGISVENLMISDRAHVVMPYHAALDKLEEESKGTKKLGTTGRGIGPAYVDKVSRVGIRMVDLIDPEALRARLEENVPAKNRILTSVYDAQPMRIDDILAEYTRYGAQFCRFVRDTGEIMYDAMITGKNVLLEGGQGTLLDLDHGTYPYVTSSSPTAGGGSIGVGVGPRRLDRVVGVFKAYITRVGEGPFPTELLDQKGDDLRERGREFGTTTGRPRRCGWFDAVLARYAVQVNGLDSAAITKLDILDDEPVIKLCIAYDIDGERVERLPASLTRFQRCKPIYEELPGWLSDTSMAREFGDLPQNARSFVERLGEVIGCQIDLISVGSSREQVITRHEIFAREV